MWPSRVRIAGTDERAVAVSVYGCAICSARGSVCLYGPTPLCDACALARDSDRLAEWPDIDLGRGGVERPRLVIQAQCYSCRKDSYCAGYYSDLMLVGIFQCRPCAERAAVAAPAPVRDICPKCGKGTQAILIHTTCDCASEPDAPRYFARVDRLPAPGTPWIEATVYDCDRDRNYDGVGHWAPVRFRGPEPQIGYSGLVCRIALEGHYVRSARAEVIGPWQ